jgi:hypothetical protein
MGSNLRITINIRKWNESFFYCFTKKKYQQQEEAFFFIVPDNTTAAHKSFFFVVSSLAGVFSFALLYFFSIPLYAATKHLRKIFVCGGKK